MKCVKISLDFAESIRQLSDTEAGRLLKSIAAYAETGEELPLGGNERILWGMIKKGIDAQRKNYDNKCESMAAARERNPNNNKSVSNQTVISQETVSEQQEPVTEKEKRKEKERSKEKETKKEKAQEEKKAHDALALEILNGHSEELLDTVDDWLRYKKEKRQSYQETGLKTLLGKIKRFADGYGDSAVVEVIRDSMSNSYQGIVWDWITKRQQKGGGHERPSSAPDHRARSGAIRYD